MEDDAGHEKAVGAVNREGIHRRHFVPVILRCGLRQGERRISLPGKTRMHLVTQARLDQANYAVTSELDRLGFYDRHVQAVETRLVLFGRPYGWHCYGSTGEIEIPRVSLSRLSHLWNGGYTSLRDVLRHEFAHAIADTHRGLFRSGYFAEAFGAAHHWNFGWEYDPEHHVSEYAAIAPAEDFAETFMVYVRHGGLLPARHATTPIRRKWKFIRRLSAAISKGLRKW